MYQSNPFLDSVGRGNPILLAMLEKLYVRTPGHSRPHNLDLLSPI